MTRANGRRPSRHNETARSRHGQSRSERSRRQSEDSQPGYPVPDGLDLVYGVHALQGLVNRDLFPAQVWVQVGTRRRHADMLSSIEAGGGKVVEMPREALDSVTRDASHQGLVAWCPPLVAEAEESLWLKLSHWQRSTPPLLLVLDGVTDVHNFGACLRSADAAGADGVIVARDKAAPLNATVRKVACGAAESMAVHQVTNLARTLSRLKTYGVWVTGTAGEADTSLYMANFREPCALVMGAEGKGMRRLTREACDFLVKLPMAGEVSSLNVSVATGICLYEAVRQRQLAT